MTTRDYLFSQGYSVEEVDAIMREIMEFGGTPAFSDPVTAEWVAADPYAYEGEDNNVEIFADFPF
jgi:hypothetical protein